MTENVYTQRKRFLIANSRDENGYENELQSLAPISQRSMWPSMPTIAPEARTDANR